MRTVAEESGTVNDDAWVAACKKVSDLAHVRLPETMHGRIERATAIAINGGIFFEEDGHTAMVRGSREGVWYTVNGACQCEDYERAPEQLCKHRLAVRIYIRAGEALREPVVLDLEPESLPAPAHGILPEHIAMISGKPYIKYAGLLALAHAQGLQQITARFISVTDTLALAEAEIVFADGRRFTEAGDATPQNVTSMVRQHFPRMALVRAKGRALRDALNIDMTTCEELGDEEEKKKEASKK